MRYAWYVVAVLTLAYIVSFIDRQILGLLVGPIQRDLDIGEKQISLLMGATFAVFTRCSAFRWDGWPTRAAAARSLRQASPSGA